MNRKPYVPSPRYRAAIKAAQASPPDAQAAPAPQLNTVSPSDYDRIAADAASRPLSSYSNRALLAEYARTVQAARATTNRWQLQLIRERQDCITRILYDRNQQELADHAAANSTPHRPQDRPDYTNDRMDADGESRDGSTQPRLKGV